MRRHTSIVLGLAFLLAAETHARAQAGGSAEQARRAFEQGVELEKKGDYPAALARFRDAAQIKATPGVRFHEGYCLEMSGKLALALEAYEQAERVEPLAPRVPQLAIRVEPRDAEVRIDGVVTTKETVRVDPGEHEIAASAREHAPKQVRSTARESATESVTLKLEPLAPARSPAAEAPAKTAAPAPPPSPPPEATEPPREEAPAGSIALPLVVTAGAVVFAGAGVGAYAIADSTQADAARECPARISCESERDKIRTFDALALAGFIGAAGLGALAVVLWSSRGTKVTAAGTTLQLRGEF
jgi:tetratricopeptide (TPR) repeat protein